MSGVSNVSESERGHLRGISETSVSTQGDYATPMESRDRGMRLKDIPDRSEPVQNRPAVVSPLTPPQGTDGDYMSAGPSSGTRRKSNFNEELDG